MSLTDPGPRNPLFFFSLALLGKVPNFVPNDSESLNQLECIEEVLNKLPATPMLMASLENVIAVTCDALLCLCSSESKRSLPIRFKAICCLHQLLLKVSCNFVALLEIFPGVLSKMIKVASGRVDTEDDALLLVSLRIIEVLVREFWNNQVEWQIDVVERERFKTNVDVAISALKPLVFAEGRRSDWQLQSCLSSIFATQALSSSQPRSRVVPLALQHAALNSFTLPCQFQNAAFTEYAALMDWFDSTLTFDQELDGKLLCLLGILSVEGAAKVVSISQIFALCLLRLFELSESKIGSVVDVEFSESLIGTENVFASQEGTARKAPEIRFKRKQKYCSPVLSEKLFAKLVELDSNAVSKEIFAASADALLLLDLTAQFLKLRFDSNLFSAAMKQLRLVPTLSIEEGQLLQLAALKVLWARFAFPSSRAELQQHLPFVLLCSASSWLLLREISTELLRFMAASSDSSLPGFLCAHQQFLLDRLAVQLAQPGLFPEAPNIIAALLNHLLDEAVVNKFSDLLVGKVTENLGLYRTFPAYCRGLLQVTKGTLTKLKHKQSALDLMRIAQYFIVADSKNVRIAAFEALQVGLEIFDAEDSELCQLLHVAWPGILVCLESTCALKAFDATQLDFKLCEALLSFIAAAAAKCPIFLRDRLAKDFWRGCLKKHRFGTISRIDSFLIACLTDCLSCCLFSTEIILEILQKFGAFNALNEMVSLFEVIARIEPDALWYFLVFEGGALRGAELCAPAEHLQSYPTPCLNGSEKFEKFLELV